MSQQVEETRQEVQQQQQQHDAGSDVKTLEGMLSNLGFDPVTARVLASELVNDDAVKKLIETVKSLDESIKSITELPEPIRSEASRTLSTALRRVRTRSSLLNRLMELSMINQLSMNFNEAVRRLEDKIEMAIRRLESVIADGGRGSTDTNIISMLMSRIESLETKLMDYHEKLINLIERSYDERIKHIENIVEKTLTLNHHQQQQPAQLPRELVETLQSIANALSRLDARVSMLESVVLQRKDPLEEAARTIQNVKQILSSLKEIDTQYFASPGKEEDEVQRAISKVMSFINQLAKIRSALSGAKTVPPPPPPQEQQQSAESQVQEQQQSVSQESQASTSEKPQEAVVEVGEK